MLRRAMETAGFPAFLGFAATYALVAMFTAVVLANELSRAPLAWHSLLPPFGMLG
jgi:hypothetical protein